MIKTVTYLSHRLLFLSVPPPIETATADDREEKRRLRLIENNAPSIGFRRNRTLNLKVF